MSNESGPIVNIKEPTPFPRLREERNIPVDLSPFSSLPFKLGISKGKMETDSVLYLRSMGWVFPENFLDRQYSFQSQNSKVFRLPSEDLIDLTLQGYLDFAIVGADKIYNAQLLGKPIIPILPLNFKKSKFCVEVPLDKECSPLEITSVIKSSLVITCKKLAEFTKYFINQRYNIYSFESYVMDGSLEVSPSLFPNRDMLIFDIVETGKTLQENGLRIADVITEIPGAYVVTNNKFLQLIKLIC
jgi:ATP phosphoribosyltransferase